MQTQAGILEIILLGYSPRESETIREVLTPLASRYAVSCRNIGVVADLTPTLATAGRCLVVSNDWQAGIDVNRVIECCKRRIVTPPIVVVSENEHEEFAHHAIESGVDDYVFWDRLFLLRSIIQRRLGRVESLSRRRARPAVYQAAVDVTQVSVYRTIFGRSEPQGSRSPVGLVTGHGA